MKSLMRIIYLTIEKNIKEQMSVWNAKIRKEEYSSYPKYKVRLVVKRFGQNIYIYEF